jgi:hypothetical protein
MSLVRATGNLNVFDTTGKTNIAALGVSQWDTSKIVANDLTTGSVTGTDFNVSGNLVVSGQTVFNVPFTGNPTSNRLFVNKANKVVYKPN